MGSSRSAKTGEELTVNKALRLLLILTADTDEAVDAYRNSGTQIGGSVALAAGPAGGVLKKGEKSAVWTYTRSKGVYGGATLDTMTIKELADVNAEFYGGNVSVTKILAGDVEARDGGKEWPAGVQRLRDVLRVV